jgi:hypothetical protein
MNIVMRPYPQSPYHSPHPEEDLNIATKSMGYDDGGIGTY